MNSSTRYYAFIAGAVHGPYTFDELKSFYQPDLQVCAEGTEEWRRAADVAELAELMVPAPVHMSGDPSSRPQSADQREPDQQVKMMDRESPPDELAPKLKELWLICRNAPDDLLKQQRAKHWRKYFKNEQSILAAEFGRRGLTK